MYFDLSVDRKTLEFDYNSGDYIFIQEQNDCIVDLYVKRNPFPWPCTAVRVSDQSGCSCGSGVGGAGQRWQWRWALITLCPGNVCCLCLSVHAFCAKNQLFQFGAKTSPTTEGTYVRD